MHGLWISLRYISQVVARLDMDCRLTCSDTRRLRSSAGQSDDRLLGFERFPRCNACPLVNILTIFSGTFTKRRGYHGTRRRSGSRDWRAVYRPFVADNARDLGACRSPIASLDLLYVPEVGQRCRVWGYFGCGAARLNCRGPGDNKIPPNVCRYTYSLTESLGYVGENGKSPMQMSTCIIRRNTGIVGPREKMLQPHFHRSEGSPQRGRFCTQQNEACVDHRQPTLFASCMHGLVVGLRRAGRGYPILGYIIYGVKYWLSTPVPGIITIFLYETHRFLATRLRRTRLVIHSPVENSCSAARSVGDSPSARETQFGRPAEEAYGRPTRTRLYTMLSFVVYLARHTTLHTPVFIFQ